MDDYFLFDTAREAEFDRLAELACRSVLSEVGLVTLVNKERQFFKADFQLPEPWSTWRETPISHSFCAHVAEMGAPLMIENARTHPLVSKNPGIIDLGVSSYIGHPIHRPDGISTGAVCALQRSPRSWSENDSAAMRIIAELVDDQIKIAANKAPWVR